MCDTCCPLVIVTSGTRFYETTPGASAAGPAVAMRPWSTDRATSLQCSAATCLRVCNWDDELPIVAVFPNVSSCSTVIRVQLFGANSAVAAVDKAITRWQPAMAYTVCSTLGLCAKVLLSNLCYV